MGYNKLNYWHYSSANTGHLSPSGIHARELVNNRRGSAHHVASATLHWRLSKRTICSWTIYKKAQLSLTNPRDAKACQKLLQLDLLTTLSLTILAYLHAFSCCCVRNLRNPGKFTENSNLWSSRSSKVIDLGANRKPICDLLLVMNSNFSRICCRFRDIHG